MKERMIQLEDELTKILKRIDQIQKGNGGYGSRASRGISLGSDYSGSRGSRNASNDSYNKKPVGRYVSPLQKN